MTPPTISTLAHDLGAMPVQSVHRPSPWHFAVPVIFWASLVALVGVTTYRARAQRYIDADAAALQRAIANTEIERTATEKHISALRARFAFAQTIDDWAASSPALAPAVGAILHAFEEARIKLLNIHLARHPGENTAYDLQLTLIGNGDIGPYVTLTVDQHLARAGWAFLEESAKPVNGALEIDAVISPSSVDHPSP